MARSKNKHLPPPISVRFFEEDQVRIERAAEARGYQRAAFIRFAALKLASEVLNEGSEIHRNTQQAA